MNNQLTPTVEPYPLDIPPIVGTPTIILPEPDEEEDDEDEEPAKD